MTYIEMLELTLQRKIDLLESQLLSMYCPASLESRMRGKISGLKEAIILLRKLPNYSNE